MSSRQTTSSSADADRRCRCKLAELMVGQQIVSYTKLRDNKAIDNTSDLITNRRINNANEIRKTKDELDFEPNQLELLLSNGQKVLISFIEEENFVCKNIICTDIDKVIAEKREVRGVGEFIKVGKSSITGAPKDSYHVTVPFFIESDMDYNTYVVRDVQGIFQKKTEKAPALRVLVTDTGIDASQRQKTKVITEKPKWKRKTG